MLKLHLYKQLVRSEYNFLENVLMLEHAKSSEQELMPELPL